MTDLAARVAAMPKPGDDASAAHKEAYKIAQDYAAEDALGDKIIGIYRDWIIRETQQAQVCHRCIRRFRVNMTEVLRQVQEVEARIDAL